MAAIVLAAGDSVRLGQPKQLLTLPGSTEPLITRTARLLLEAGCSPVLVVLGACDQPCRQALVNLPAVRILYNEHWREGMGATLRIGINNLLNQINQPDPESVLVTVTDQYRLTARSFAALLAAHHQKPEAPATAALYNSRAGVPAIFRPELFPALAALQADQGARTLLAQLAPTLTSVPMPEAAYDLDTPPDLRSLAQTRDPLAPQTSMRTTKWLPPA